MLVQRGGHQLCRADGSVAGGAGGVGQRGSGQGEDRLAVGN